ncbi:MAG: phosphonate degradation HD-domain oxygenase [Spirosomataceae bacterium]
MNNPVETIITLFREHGDSQYGGEPVSQLEHALQAAHLAVEEGENDSLVAACLLHDIGHLLHELPNDAPEQGIDDLHEDLAGNFLKTLFVDAVVEPVQLHVASKRYLCTREPSYWSILSEPSIVSLHLQGGPMSESECLSFEQNPYHQDAVRLRRYDDMAKIPNFETRPIEFYEPILKAVLK